MAFGDFIPHVHAHCPMGCGDRHMFLDGGRVMCHAEGCPDPTAAASLLADGETEHIVQFGTEDYTVRHPRPRAHQRPVAALPPEPAHRRARRRGTAVPGPLPRHPQGRRLALRGDLMPRRFCGEPGDGMLCGFKPNHHGRHSWETPQAYTRRVIPGHEPWKTPPLSKPNPARAKIARLAVVGVFAGVSIAGVTGGFNWVDDAFGATAKRTPGCVTQAEAVATRAGERVPHAVRRTTPHGEVSWNSKNSRDLIGCRDSALRVKWLKGDSSRRITSAWWITCEPYQPPNESWTCDKDRLL